MSPTFPIYWPIIAVLSDLVSQRYAIRSTLFAGSKIVFNRGLATTEKDEKWTECTVCTVQNVWWKKSESGVKRAKWQAVWTVRIAVSQAAWIEPTAAVSTQALAGTSQSSLQLNFLNEVTRSNETLYRLHANVIDSCIDIIVGRPLIREHHLIHKLPHYFDETTSTKFNLSQSVTPVKPSLAKASSICAQGYDNALCSVTMKRPDHPFVLQERRRRPHVDAFADLTPIDESTLIKRRRWHRMEFIQNASRECEP